MMKTGNKYGARKTTTADGQKFDSVKELRRWGELQLLQKAGKIFGLQRQVKYELIPRQDGERACVYIADFVYIDPNGNTVVEDVKGFKTDVYKLKKKMMLWRYGIRIREV